MQMFSHLQARQPTSENSIKIGEATVMISVQPSNQFDPDIFVPNNGNGYIYENTPAGGAVFIEPSPPHTRIALTITDPDLVSNRRKDMVHI